MEVNVLLFPDFETLDAFGPVEILGRSGEYLLNYVSMDGGMVRSRQGAEIATRPLEDVSETGILSGRGCLSMTTAFLHSWGRPRRGPIIA